MTAIFRELNSPALFREERGKIGGFAALVVLPLASLKRGVGVS
jgi:hypothetical protein